MTFEKLLKGKEMIIQLVVCQITLISKQIDLGKQKNIQKLNNKTILLEI